MEPVPGVVSLLQGLALAMTAPTFDSVVTIATGWVLASWRMMTRMTVAVGSLANKHYWSYIACLAGLAGRSTRWGWPGSI